MWYQAICFLKHVGGNPFRLWPNILGSEVYFQRHLGLKWVSTNPCDHYKLQWQKGDRQWLYHLQRRVICKMVAKYHPGLRVTFFITIHQHRLKEKKYRKKRNWKKLVQNNGHFCLGLNVSLSNIQYKHYFVSVTMWIQSKCSYIIFRKMSLQNVFCKVVAILSQS